MSGSSSWAPIATMLFLAVAMVAGLVWMFARHESPTLTVAYYETMSESALRERARDPTAIAHGQLLFLRNCTLCHGAHGQGLVGPNLRDDYWLHSSDLQHIVEAIANGNPQNGMAPWRPVFSDDDLRDLAAYIASLAGSEDGSGKAPQGTLSPMTWRQQTTTP